MHECLKEVEDAPASKSAKELEEAKKEAKEKQARNVRPLAELVTHLFY